MLKPSNFQSPSVMQILRDIVLIGVLLAGLNAVISSADRGWLLENPTPWLLLPALIGLRYGLWAGCVAGGLVAAGIVFANTGTGGKDTTVEFADTHAITLVALIIAGFICGEARELAARRNKEWTENGKWLESENKRLRAECDLARQARHQIQQRLAMWNAPLACLDDDLRKLIPMAETEVYDGLLRTLYTTCQLTAGAIYQIDGAVLRPLASLHTSARFQAPIRLADFSMARMCISSGELVTLEVAAAESGEAACLAVLPWDAHGTRGVLVIEDMPLAEFNWSVLERVELIVRWTFMLRDLRRAVMEDSLPGGLMPNGDFLTLLGRSLQTAKDHLLPSSSVTLRLANNQSGDFKELVKAAASVAPEVCAMTAMPGDTGLVVLLPFAGDAAAESMAQGVRQRFSEVRAARFTIAGAERPEDLWGRLLQG
jgi:hypothetical protein